MGQYTLIGSLDWPEIGFQARLGVKVREIRVAFNLFDSTTPSAL